MSINRLDQNYLKTLTVLYVEDDDDTREQFCEFLSRPVGRLITATNGAEGLEAFINHSPDIVVTDILMPIMDGLTMAYEIRGIVQSVPIIVVTAFEQTDYLKRAIDVGIDKYVTKPVNSYLLFESMLDCAHRLRAEEQLNLAQKREIQAVWLKHHEIIATLAGGLAHDFNNLMQAIFGFVSLAKMNLDETSKSWECLKNVDECFEQATILSQQLKLLGRDSDNEMKTAALMPVIRHSLETALQQHDNITLMCDYPDDLPAVRFVEQHIHLIYSRLADRLTMPAGGMVSLSARTSEISEFSMLPLLPGSYLHVTLTDSGPGIPADILPNIFDPYYSTKNRGAQKGMGLSLALCFTIIMKHGGIITAESSEGRGTTFDVWLPVAFE